MDWFRNKKDTKQPQEPAAPVISQPDIQTEDVSSRSQCLAQLNKLFAPVPSKGMSGKLQKFKSGIRIRILRKAVITDYSLFKGYF